VLLSLTAALNPTLLTATTVMLLLPSPTALMLGYWLGAMLTSITLGLVIVFSLQGSSEGTAVTNSPQLWNRQCAPCGLRRDAGGRA
jgi:hypothetical protein